MNVDQFNAAQAWIRLQTPPSLDAHGIAARDRINAMATRWDGVAPLSDDALLASHGALGHVVAWAGAAIVGYGFQAAAGGTAEVVVAPWARGLGVGRALLQEIGRTGATGVWAHGDLAAARALARWAGARTVRELLVMSRPLTQAAENALAPTSPSRHTPPAGVTITDYQGPEDDVGLLRVNAAAFVDLADQGSWTRTDVAARMASDWWDPAGLFIARADTGEVVGFHWTKRRSPTEGEIYVLACDPDWQGRGVGRALIDVGLAHLAAGGATTAILYVDSSNTSARTAYRKAGFTVRSRDVLYTRDSPAPLARETIRTR